MLNGMIKNPARTFAIVGAAAAGMVALAACGKEEETAEKIGSNKDFAHDFIQGTQDEPGSGLTRTDARRLGGMVSSKDGLSYSDGTRAAQKYKELLPAVEAPDVARSLAAKFVSDSTPRKLLRNEWPGHNAPVSAAVDAFAGAKSVLGDRATPIQTLSVAQKGVMLNTGGKGDYRADGVTAAQAYDKALTENGGNHEDALYRGKYLMNGTRSQY